MSNTTNTPPRLRPSPNAAMALLSEDDPDAYDDMGGETDCPHGCYVEPDGYCPHGYVSALRTLGMI